MLKVPAKIVLHIPLKSTEIKMGEEKIHTERRTISVNFITDLTGFIFTYLEFLNVQKCITAPATACLRMNMER